MYEIKLYITIAAIGLIIRAAYLVLYRLYFHPLARVPGPWLARVTQWYEFYYDVLKWPGGQYWLKVDQMHERYGPIVRVTPFEVHIKDPEWYDQLYSTASEGARDKWGPSASMTGTPLGIFGTVDHNVHHRRRAAISAFFSKRAISDIEPWIHHKMDTLCSTMKNQQQRDGSVELRVNFLAMTTDVIAAHSLNGSHPQKTIDLLQDEERAKDWQNTIAALAMLTALVKQAPWLITVAKKLPVTLWMNVAPSLGRVVKLSKEMRKSASVAIDEWGSNSGESGQEYSDKPSFPTIERHNIFHTCLQSSLPPAEKSPERLGQEGFVAIAAGGETCGRMLTNALFHILTNKDRVMPGLKKELFEIMPTPEIRPDWQDLERLPYLTAVIRETLRLSAILTSRLPLVAPDEALQYKEFVIPPGNPISMSLRHILHNPDIFSKPLEFRPERWLPSNPDLHIVNKFYVPFSRGTRGCIGINLAYAQLYIVLACILRRFELSLHDVIYERDVEAKRDCFIGEPDLDNHGVHVTLKQMLA